MRVQTSRVMSIIVVVLALSSFAAYARAEIWNAANDFSTTSSTNHNWTFGYDSGAGGILPWNFSAATIYQPDYIAGSSPGVNGWYNVLWSPGVVHNSTGAPVTNTWAGYNTTWPTNGLSLNPPTDGSATVARWIAPATGLYTVNATFTEIQNTPNRNMQVGIMTGTPGTHSWTPLTPWAPPIVAGPYTYSSTLTVLAGDAIDFGAIGFSNPTGNVLLDATITSTPEPSTLVLLTIGLVSLLAYAWRKRK